MNKSGECEQFVDVGVVVPSAVVVDEKCTLVIQSVVGVRRTRDSEAAVDENEVEQFVSLERFDAVIMCCCVVEYCVAEPGSGSNVGMSQLDSLVELVVFHKHCCVLVPRI